MKQGEERSGPIRSSPEPPDRGSGRSAPGKAAWKLLLLLPFLGLSFPALYARNNPEWMGLPFFYWYQFAWVVVSSALMAVVYRKLRL